MPQKKKLSLEEARNMFLKKEDRIRPNNQQRGGNKYQNSRPRKSNNNKYTNSQSKDQIRQKISQLERKIQFDSLTEEEEDKIMAEIGKLEEQIK
jgi:uncharacterized coiled-coil DUF342 family protein